MQKLLKKAVTLILTVALVGTQFAFTAVADSDYELDYSVNSDGKTVTVTGFKTEPSGEYDLVIPRKVKIDGKPYTVTAIANGVTDASGCSKSIFGGTRINGTTKYNSTLKSVQFPDTLKEIGNGAFFACEKLTEIEFPQGLERIGVQAFRMCVNVSSIGVLPESLKSIDEWAFGDLETLGNVINYPSSAKISKNVFQSAFRGRSKGLYANLIINEGPDTFPGIIYRCNWLETLVLPSSVKKAEISVFMNDELKRLQSVYILSDEFKWDLQRNISTGSVAKMPPTKWYVANETVASALEANGIERGNIIVMNGKTVVLSESENTFSINNADGEFFTLPAPERSGYRFVCWTDGMGEYAGGSDYPVQHSAVLQAVWEKDYEKDTVLYRKAQSNQGTAQIENCPVSKIICPELALQKADVTLTDEDGYEETVSARFDGDGEWRNLANDSRYVSVKIDGVSDYSVLYETDGGFEVTVGLKDPTVIAYPRIEGISSLADLSWSSSDVTVAKVSDGVVTGVKSGTAVINAEYGSSSFSFTVTVKGEIAAAKENGTESEYLESKKPITDAVKKAIADGDKDGLVEIITSTGEIKLSEIKDIDTEDVDSADSEYISEFADRLLTRTDIKFDTIDDVSLFGEILAKEFAAGKLNHIKTASEADEVINAYNGYFGFDTGNEYYKMYKDKILAKFLDYTAVNHAGANSDFNEFLILTAVANAANYQTMEKTVDDLADKIGYDSDHYGKNKCYEMFAQMTENKENYKSAEEIKKFIDGYTKPQKDADNSGGGTGGGGGGSKTSKSSSVSVGSDYTAPQITVDDPTPLFADIAGDRWSYKALAYLTAKGVTGGYEDGSFRPENSITRAEFVKIASVAFEYVYEEKEDDESEFAVPDVSKADWFYPYVRGAFEGKIATGDNDGCFNPNDRISRQEAAAIIFRIAAAKGVDLNGNVSISIKDISDISDWAYTAVIQLVKGGIISGYGDGAFRPNCDISREEAAKLIYELLYRVNGRDGK